MHRILIETRGIQEFALVLLKAITTLKNLITVLTLFSFSSTMLKNMNRNNELSIGVGLLSSSYECRLWRQDGWL